jgi:hypothetical protein
MDRRYEELWRNERWALGRKNIVKYDGKRE